MGSQKQKSVTKTVIATLDKQNDFNAKATKQKIG